MNPRKLGLGFLFAAGGMLLPLVLPLSTEATAGLLARPAVLAVTLSAAALFALAALVAAPLAIGLGLAGAFGGCVASLALLHDTTIAGSAAKGFWFIVLATWLGAALCVTALAAVRARRPRQRRALDIAVPLLFGAFVFYLWEVSVRGLGVPPVLMPSPSAAAARFVASLPILGADFFQTFTKGVLIG
jgi:NitT/TauT family transport system permease protein